MSNKRTKYSEAGVTYSFEYVEDANWTGFEFELVHNSLNYTRRQAFYVPGKDAEARANKLVAQWNENGRGMWTCVLLAQDES